MAASVPLMAEANAKIALGVAGSIAAYKAVLVARGLLQAGADVRALLSQSGARMVGSATFAGITGNPVQSSMWQEGVAGEPHVELSHWADVLALVPATADLLASLAQGRANDLLRATALCSSGPIVVAPAMHPRMWHNPATQRNIALLQQDERFVFVGPVAGEVASGDRGMGRMAEPAEIVAAILAQVHPLDLQGQRIVITAGPTVEDIDPARFISNRSSGKMGYALARRASERGAAVTLISGPTALQPPPRCSFLSVRSATQMREALWQCLGADLSGADALIMCAAVADYSVSSVSNTKIKRGDNPSMQLQLTANPDLLAEVGAARRGTQPRLIGFALETLSGQELRDAARAKLKRKGIDLIVANEAETAFDGDENTIQLVGPTEATSLPRAKKLVLADRILDTLTKP
jgi:phosphopantothenoylcysteine decarboxylase / phosphopantothenate---cysteine ligase